ncbi:MAG: alpha-amylase family glycosyl hydrolase, partial [Pricia sp.]
TDGTETLTNSFTVAVTPTVVEEAVPEGMLDGINLNPSDDTKATLVLYAPGKEFVHLIGDFNDWQVNDAFLMKKDIDQDRFWIELDGLTPQFDHLYQYLVEFDINIADPYSTLILDGFGNDTFIDATTFPDIPEYPSGQTQAITVLRTGEPEYVWQVTDFERPKKTDLVIYELLVRDFDERHSFDAVRERLDYLQELGINALELMPVNEFDGNESWGYNPSFHMALDKYYGTKNALKSLIDECHARGMAVFIDVVYNHGAGQHPYYRMWNTDNGSTGGQAAADNPFFNPVATHSYSVFNDFNHQSQATKDYVNRTVTYWIEEFNLDGMRWDLTKGFTQNCTPEDEVCTNATQQDRVEVLQGYSDNQWEADENFYVIFEHLGGIQEEQQWADYRLDEGKGILLWNKQTDPYNEATMGYHEEGKSNFSGVSYLQKGFGQPSAISYMESHDEERLMYKNLEFGNGNEDYSVKELNTALSRMETAGAFFFTVPGPKMIWQFGELGYEVPIDFNGRTGNKPIRWEYAEDPDRKAIYDVWDKLIDLKINEPIFETNDFELDLAAATGLKKIQLTLESASEDEIKYVTVIGNFGITGQEIVPDFQETGVWYEFLADNLKYTVTDTQNTISLAPGEFRIFGDNPTALFPNVNAPDQDNDGVADEDDDCPDTPSGASVNVSGCEVFSLPSDNFSIRLFGETCRNSDNGSISISAEEEYSYTATLTGASEASSEFSDETEFDTLPAGEYQVCITLMEQPGYQRCFDLTISEPEALSVSAKVDVSAKRLSLDLKGGETYSIRLNDTVFTTSDTTVSLALTASTNRLSVKTGKDCQGSYEETIVIASEVSVYPNPLTNGILNIDLGQPSTASVAVEIHTLSGQLVQQSTHRANGSNIQIDLSSLADGLFMVQIEFDGNTLNYKIVK